MLWNFLEAGEVSSLVLTESSPALSLPCRPDALSPFLPGQVLSFLRWTTRFCPLMITCYITPSPKYRWDLWIGWLASSWIRLHPIGKAMGWFGHILYITYYVPFIADWREIWRESHSAGSDHPCWGWSEARTQGGPLEAEGDPHWQSTRKRDLIP